MATLVFGASCCLWCPDFPLHGLSSSSWLDQASLHDRSRTALYKGENGSCRGLLRPSLRCPTILLLPHSFGSRASFKERQNRFHLLMGGAYTHRNENLSTIMVLNFGYTLEPPGGCGVMPRLHSRQLEMPRDPKEQPKGRPLASPENFREEQELGLGLKEKQVREEEERRPPCQSEHRRSKGERKWVLQNE